MGRQILAAPLGGTDICIPELLSTHGDSVLFTGNCFSYQPPECHTSTYYKFWRILYVYGLTSHVFMADISTRYVNTSLSVIHRKK